MSKKIYFLKTCDTCKRILKPLNLDSVELIEIKANPLTIKQLVKLYQLAGSYEALFNKRAKLYKEMGLKDENLSEDDFKRYLLEHYTFLKRPVALVGDKIYIGNSKKVVESLRAALD